jgi:hypothetical protein
MTDLPHQRPKDIADLELEIIKLRGEFYAAVEAMHSIDRSIDGLIRDLKEAKDAKARSLKALGTSFRFGDQ